jgi:hypothetical protein
MTIRLGGRFRKCYSHGNDFLIMRSLSCFDESSVISFRKQQFKGELTLDLGLNPNFPQILTKATPLGARLDQRWLRDPPISYHGYY